MLRIGDPINRGVPYGAKELVSQNRIIPSSPADTRTLPVSANSRLCTTPKFVAISRRANLPWRVSGSHNDPSSVAGMSSFPSGEKTRAVTPEGRWGLNRLRDDHCNAALESPFPRDEK